jgi:RNA ligase (TIGR02306 family)
MERKLASVQRVLDILPIENADAIELVRINGWQCVVKKEEFQVGDAGIFLEIDSIPPDTEIFRFLWTPRGEDPQPNTRPEKFRIRTMRLRGALSQGLLLPLTAFDLGPVAEGDNVTEQLGVAKYEPPAPTGMGDWRAPFPGYIPKTDEMRVQSAPGVLDEMYGLPYVITVKYDGTSATYCMDRRDGAFHACGRNQSVKEGANLYWEIARKYNLEAALRQAPDFVIQGEIFGPGIQKNPLGRKEKDFAAFNVYDTNTARFLNHDEARAFLTAHGIPPVAILEEGVAFAYTQEALLALAEGKYEGTDNEREGIVIRPRHETTSPTLGGRLSFKAISNRFLLKEKD